MACIFCLNETKDYVSFHGTSELAKHARNVVTKHFWFDANEINSAEKYACSYCWAEVESFYNFYGMVESNYPNILNIIEATNDVGNPSSSLAHETVVVKVENGSDDFSTDYENKQVSASSNFIQSEVKISKTDTLAVESSEELNPNTQSAQSTLQVQKKSVTFSCPVCQKQYSKAGLRFHMPSHDPEDSFILECDLCGKKFSRKSTILGHLKLHQKYKRTKDKKTLRISCPMCEKLISSGNLTTHVLKMHKNIKNVKCVCEVCGKGFPAPSSLAQHALVHLDKELTKVQCNICGKWQKTKRSLQKHKKTHKQAPQKCPHPYCDQILYNAHEMKVHTAQFHEERKHQCSICQKSFIRPIRLREHIASVHTGERLLDCLYCAKKFKSNSNRFRHIQTIHPREYDLDRGKKSK